MISMNISPPRLIAERNVASVPKVNALILNSGSRNIGSATRVSMTPNAVSDATPNTSSEMTGALVHPMLCPLAGSMP
jgi:hypothetical protein